MDAKGTYKVTLPSPWLYPSCPKVLKALTELPGTVLVYYTWIEVAMYIDVLKTTGVQHLGREPRTI